MSIFDSATFIEVTASRAVACHCICVVAGHGDVCDRFTQQGNSYFLALTSNGGAIPVCSHCATAIRERHYAADPLLI